LRDDLFRLVSLSCHYRPPGCQRHTSSRTTSMWVDHWRLLHRHAAALIVSSSGLMRRRNGRRWLLAEGGAAEFAQRAGAHRGGTALPGPRHRSDFLSDQCGGGRIAATSKLQSHAGDFESDAHGVRRLPVKVLAVEELLDWPPAFPRRARLVSQLPVAGSVPQPIINNHTPKKWHSTSRRWLTLAFN